MTDGLSPSASEASPTRRLTAATTAARGTAGQLSSRC